MNKHDLISILAEQVNLPRVKADKFITAFIDTVTKALANGDLNGYRNYLDDASNSTK